jgi:hypothetical protein
MTSDLYTKVVLTIIAICLVLIVVMGPRAIERAIPTIRTCGYYESDPCYVKVRPD